MATRTGKPRGRPKGAKNKRTMRLDPIALKAVAAIEAAIVEPFLGDAHAFLMLIYKDPTQPIALRMDAAKAAIRYEKAPLSPIEQQPPGEQTVPLLERLKHYARLEASETSDPKVVELKKPDHQPRPDI